MLINIFITRWLLDGFSKKSEENTEEIIDNSQVKTGNTEGDENTDVPQQITITDTLLALPTLPPRIPKRGRPKGNNKTAIGIPKKGKIDTVGLVSFQQL
ncbi:PHD-type domain-containing protein [Aphis craccivora]|uniref:PHD-type domain-containing protein n=1 Tax=Aphis craccivora TaxID=307492 RepID=A0A6G0YKP1_APHCR|nr:PHD-type domain-containing protein [Aphis craccivora]